MKNEIMSYDNYLLKLCTFYYYAHSWWLWKGYQIVAWDS